MVRILEDDGRHVIIAFSDGTKPGPTMYVIGKFSVPAQSYWVMASLVGDLNDFITTNMRLVGLDADEFARNGIE